MKALKSLGIAVIAGALALAATVASAQMVNNPGPAVWTPSGDVTVHDKSEKSAKPRDARATDERIAQTARK